MKGGEPSKKSKARPLGSLCVCAFVSSIDLLLHFGELLLLLLLFLLYSFYCLIWIYLSENERRYLFTPEKEIISGKCTVIRTNLHNLITRSKKKLFVTKQWIFKSCEFGYHHIVLSIHLKVKPKPHELQRCVCLCWLDFKDLKVGK